MTQLAALAKRFPASVVHQRQVGGGFMADYVAHSVVTEKLLAILGPFDWSVRVIDGQTVVGTIAVDIDARRTHVDGVGIGDDLKDAESDALKRAAMRMGVGLHLWSGEDYRLDRAVGDAE